MTNVCKRIQSKESESEKEKTKKREKNEHPLYTRLRDNFEAAHKIWAKVLTGNDKYSRAFK